MNAFRVIAWKLERLGVACIILAVFSVVVGAPHAAVPFIFAGVVFMLTVLCVEWLERRW